MLPDFRFAIGAILAITMLGVTGFGLAMSVQLMHEARVGSFDASRSLAFADHSDQNRFYDPDAARRFQGIEIKADDPGADAPVDTTENTPAAVARAAPEDRTASLAKLDIKSDIKSNLGAGQAVDSDSAPAVATTPAPDEPGKGPPDPVAAIPDAPVQVASAPAALPPAARLADGEPPAQPIAGVVPLPPSPAKPAAHARPRHRHFARTARPPPPPTTFSDSGFPLTNEQWPSSDGGLNATPAGKQGQTRLTRSSPGR